MTGNREMLGHAIRLEREADGMDSKAADLLGQMDTLRDEATQRRQKAAAIRAQAFGKDPEIVEA